MAREDNTGNKNQRSPQSKQSTEMSEKYAEIQERILKTEAEIGKLRSRNASSLNEQLRIEEQINKAQRSRVNDLQELREIEKEISTILDEEESSQQSIVDIVKKRRKDQSEVKDLTESVLNSMREQKYQMSGISDAGKQVTENMQATSGFGTSFSNILERAKNQLAEGASFSSEFMDTLYETNKIREDYRDIEREIADGAKNAAEGTYNAKQIEEDLVKKTTQFHVDEEKFQDKKNAFEKNIENMTHQQIRDKQLELDLEEAVLKARKLSIDAMSEQNKVLGETSKTAEKTLGVFDKITSGDFKGALLQKFGLDEINSQLKEKVGGALVNVVKSVKAGDLKGAFSEAGKGLKGILDMAGKLTMALGIGAIFMLGKFLIDTFMEADKEVAQLGKDFGISKNEAKELHHTTVDVANQLKITGINSEQVAKSLKTASENLGGLDLTGPFNSGNAAVQQMVKNTAVLTEKFGLSGEEAGKMNNNAAIAGKSVGEMSMMASKLGNGIFTAKESLKILADIPPSVVSSMSKMPEAMIKTAQKAKLLGMSMKQIQDIGRKTLDIESSLEAQMEAQVLLGKNINLDKMRAAALNGDQETVMNEILNAAGSLEDFNNMNVIQKEALAKATGMEVDQLAEMLGKQQELNDAGLTEAKLKELQKMNEKDLADEISKTTDKEKRAYLEKMQAERKSEATQAAMADLMKRIQELAVKLVTPIMDVVDGLMNGEEGAAAMDGILNAVSGTIKMMVPGIKMIASVIGFLIKPLTYVLGLFSGTEETTHEVADAAGKVAGGVEEVNNKVSPLLSGFGSLLGIVTTIGGFFAGKALLGKGMDMLKSKAGDLGKTLISKVGGPLGKMGSKLLGGGGSEKAASVGGLGGDSAAVGEAEKGKNMVSGILDKMKSIIDSIKGVVQSAIGFVRDVGKDLLATLKDVIAGIGDILREGATIVVDVGTKLAEGAMKILNIIMDGLASAANSLPTIMGALGKAVVAFFTPMASLVNPMVIGGILIFTGAMIGLAYAFKLLGEGIGAAAPGITAFFDGVGGVIKAVGEAIAKVIETITTSVIRLQDIDGAKMAKAAFGIYAIAGALAAFGGGSVFAGIGSALGEFFGGDPVEKFNRFASIDAKQLNAVATAINLLAQAMKTFSSAIDQVNFDKVDEMVSKLEDLKDAQVSGAVSDLATTGISAVTGFLGNVFGGSSKEETASPVTDTSGGGGTSMAKVEQKLDTLIGLFSQVATQPTVIKFGDKTVEEIKNQLNFKKSYNVGVDNTYGRTI